MRKLYLGIRKDGVKYRIIDRFDKKPYVLDGKEVDFGGFATKAPAEYVKQFWNRFTLDKKNHPCTLASFYDYLDFKLGRDTLGYPELKALVASRTPCKASKPSQATPVAPTPEESPVEAPGAVSRSVAKRLVVQKRVGGK